MKLRAWAQVRARARARAGARAGARRVPARARAHALPHPRPPASGRASRKDPCWEGVGSPALQCPRGVEKLCSRAQGLKLCCDGTGKGVPLEATENDDFE